MQWYIIGRDMHTLCVASTDIQDSLPINDEGDDMGQKISIVNNCAIGTYKFVTDPSHKDAKYITEGNYVAFRDKYQKDRLYTIMSVEGETSWTVSCEGIGMDLINEYAVPWEYTEKSIEDTLYPVLYDSGWEIGINEVSDYKRSTKFTGTEDSQLTRLGDVCNQFDAECDFVIEMKGSSVVSQKVNIYKTLGEDRANQRFIDGINLISLHRSGSIEKLVTCVRCYGREDENGNKLTIADITYDDGRYYSPKGDIRIYDREARNKWSRFRAYGYEGQTEFSGYINGTFEYDTDDAQELFNRGLSDLKDRNDVKMEYEVSLNDIKADIGDTIQISDNRFQEKVYLEARVQEVQNHYSVVGKDTGVITNYKKLVSSPAAGVSDIIDQIKNQIISIKETEVTYQVSDSGTEAPTGNWVSNPPQTKPGQYLWTRTITVYTNGSQIIEYSVSRNGNDGQDGKDGKDGKDGTSVTILGSYDSEEALKNEHPTGTTGDAYIVNGDLYVWDESVTDWKNVGKIQGPQGTPGTPGKDGRTPYLHIKYSNDGGLSFTGNEGEDPGEWLGQYSDYELNDSTDPTKYTWTKLKGDKGDKGEKGDTGTPGPAGQNGKTTYFHVKYSPNPDGNPMFEIPDTYIGTYADFTELDSTDYRDYTWSKFQGSNGEQGIPGKNGEDGMTSYLHIKYSNDGGSTFTENNGETPGEWIGQYVDFKEQDSQSVSDYKWSKIKGDKGDKGDIGEQGTPGQDGAPGLDGAPGKDGKMIYAFSSTASDDPDKIATLFGVTDLELTTGTTVSVLFQNENTADSPTLNIGSGAKPVYTQGLRSAYWSNQSSVIFVYDGANWQVSSAPVYASEATIGNPVGNHVYLKDAVYLMNGNVVLALFTSRDVTLANGGSLETYPGQLSLRYPSGKKDLAFTLYTSEGQKDRAVISAEEIILKTIREDGSTTVFNHIGHRKDFGYDEYYTGDIWLGKEIYQKLIHVGAISGTTKIVSHGAANVDTIWVDVSNSFVKANTGGVYGIPRVTSAALNQLIGFHVDDTNLYIDAGSNASFSDCYVTIRYTKK